MKRMLSLVLSFVLLMVLCEPVFAQRFMSVSGKSYDLEVRNVDIFVRQGREQIYRVLKEVQSTGMKENVREITLEYDFEAQKAEHVARFEEDAPMALVTVHGLEESLAHLEEEEVVITVNGLPLCTEAGSDLEGHVGWEDVVHDGAYSVVFPIELTKQGGIFDYTVRVQGLAQDVKVTETARIRVKLVNTHEYKDEKTCRILNVECKDAEVYIVGDKLYVDHPVGAARDVKIKLTFGDENGDTFSCITWAQDTVCEKEKAQAALQLEKEIRLDKDSAAEYSLVSGSEDALRQKVRFVLETKEAVYKTREYGIEERFDVQGYDPKGIYFAVPEMQLRVGEECVPLVLGVRDGRVIKSGVFGTLSFAAGENTDAQVIDVTDGKTVIAVRPGTAYVTARYVCAGKDYDASSVKITVVQAAAQEHTVLCDELNVRAGAGIGEKVIGRLHRGDKVRVVQIKNGWARLESGGYVAAQYIG